MILNFQSVHLYTGCQRIHFARHNFYSTQYIKMRFGIGKWFHQKWFRFRIFKLNTLTFLDFWDNSRLKKIIPTGFFKVIFNIASRWP